MSGRIANFIREYVLVISIIFVIVGLFIFLMGVIWYGLRDLQLGFYTDIINNLGDWNFYLLILGFIVLVAGLWYLYSYLKNRKFISEELETNKRSEFMKKHAEVKNVVRHMPSKYRKIFEEKEKELKIK